MCRSSMILRGAGVFQLPLSGSRGAERRQSRLPRGHAFNSLSRDHVSLRASAYSPRSSALSTPSLGIMDEPCSGAMTGPEVMVFQLPLSGSRRTKRKVWWDENVRRLSTPSLGITCQEPSTSANNPAAGMLSTPSLGITRRHKTAAPVQHHLCPFNSLSRDHTIEFAATPL